MMKRMKKKGATLAIGSILMLIIAVLVVTELTGSTNILKAVGEGGDDDTPIPQAKSCSGGQSPQLTVLCRDTHSKGTAVAGDVQYIVNGDNTIQTTNCGSAITGLDSGDKIEYIVNATGASYYGAHNNAVIGCVETETEFLLAYSTTADIQVFSQDDGLIVSQTATESIAANEEPTLTVKIIPQADKGIQNAVLIVQRDRTYQEDSDSPLSAGTVGEHVSFVAHINSSASYAYDGQDKYNVGTIQNGVTFETTITFDETSSAAAFSSPMLLLDDMDWVVDDENGAFVFASSDPDDSSDVGQAYQTINQTVWTSS